MTTARDKRAAAAFAGYTARRLRLAGLAVTPSAASRNREGLRVRTLARSRCRVVADLDNAREARDLIDAVVKVLHAEHTRTERTADDSVVVFRLGTRLDSTDTRDHQTG